ncbi:hypothetical protein FNAPI_58 [Fusarium napiforme]|uniref:Uncharacterized protein n=1 Tax=Fusarium napiforme TaxID=42672 RepID=A0A8H5KAS4_9HYPO|nr:hypothetical protein FNAPI_58 [Fusarium napiforme]
METNKGATAYFIVSPNPIEGSKPNKVWIKFGDTKNPENTRSSQYNTYNPSFYMVTIYIEAAVNTTHLGKSLEKKFLKRSDDYEQVNIQTEGGWRFVHNINKPEFDEVKEESFKINSTSSDRVLGKKVTFNTEKAASKWFGVELKP